MTINVKRDFELVTLEITGRLDTTTAPNLESVINELSEDTKELVFDMSGIEYISSAGIRVLLGAYKRINSHQGTMRIKKTNERVTADKDIIPISIAKGFARYNSEKDKCFLDVFNRADDAMYEIKRVK